MDRGVVFWSGFIAVLLLVVAYLALHLCPENTVDVTHVKPDYYNDTVRFRFNGVEWTVKIAGLFPTEYSDVRVRFEDGKPAIIFVRVTPELNSYINAWWEYQVLDILERREMR